MAFGITILAGAFLLFQVQPLVSKAILPWFGGCPAVWTTCMLFFQVVLFAGYCYAHLLQRWLAPRRQAAVHLALVVAALALLPILPGAHWKPQDSSNPTWQILLLLAATVGLPYFALSATSPLVQAWFSGVCPDRSPYRLYALSNAGSLVALLSYPFLFEPAFALRQQSLLWSGSFILYAALCGASLVSVWRCVSPLPLGEGPAGTGEDSRFKVQGLAISRSSNLQISKSPSPRWLDRLRWLALPACASLMLLATTNHVCQDVAVVPFLWVIPLALYLFSFIVTFDHARWYVRQFWAAAAILALIGSVANDFTRLSEDRRFFLNLSEELTLYLGAMFCACMVCHGELARLKPRPRHLTEFYLWIAAGGAIGGLLVGVAAPHCLKANYEWQIGVALSGILSAGLLVSARWKRTDAVAEGKKLPTMPYSERRQSRSSAGPIPPRTSRRLSLSVVVRSTLFACAVLAVVVYLVCSLDDASYVRDRARNFYGVVAVCDYYSDDPDKHELLLRNGQITHGCQFVDPAKHHWPTTYYGETSGVGRAILGLQKSGPVRVGAIGLGVGTLAAYARPGDLFRFYEINPQVVEMAKKHFTYLVDCRGQCEIKLGDARLSLEAEPPQEKFDVIVVDAFSGDSIPTHLLTVEAFDIYRKHLALRGVIAVHVSNRYLRWRRSYAAWPSTAGCESHGLTTQATKAACKAAVCGFWSQTTAVFCGRIPPVRLTGAWMLSRRRSGPTSTAICSKFLRRRNNGRRAGREVVPGITRPMVDTPL